MRSIHFFSCLSICLVAGCISHQEMITYLNYRLEPVKKRKAEIFMVESHQMDLLIRRYHRMETGGHYLTRTYQPKEDGFRCIQEERFYSDGTPQYRYTLAGEDYQIGPQQEWHPNGQLKQEYVSPGQEGYWRRWYPNGQLQLRFHYRKGERQGWQSYWDEEGTLLYQRYEGEFVEGDPALEEIAAPFLRPTAADAANSTARDLKDRWCLEEPFGVRYPKIARDAGIMGRGEYWVYVDEIGQVLDYEIQKSIHPILDNSVARGLFGCLFEQKVQNDNIQAGWMIRSAHFETIN